MEQKVSEEEEQEMVQEGGCSDKRMLRKENPQEGGCSGGRMLMKEDIREGGC